MDDDLQALLKYPFVILTGFLVTFLLTPLVQRLAPVIGAIDTPDARRIHKTPIPRCGLSLFLGVHAACAAVFLIPWAPFHGQLSAHWWARMLVLTSLLFAVGLADDIRPLRPTIKLAGQFLVASLAFYWNLRVGKILGFELPLALDYLATVFWFLLIINAFNLIDGIDGLATGLGAIAALGLAGSFLLRRSPGDTMLLLGMVGACMAFLRYNANPARIFLGDSGSMFIGFMLAAIPLDTGAKGTAIASIGVPLLAVGVPLLDTALAVWRRGARRLLHHQEGNTSGRFFQPDMDHMHHRLLRAGLSQRAAASALHLFSLGLVGAGLLSMLFRSHAMGIYIVMFVVAVYVIVRHLAHVELWDSGRAIVRGLSRPSGNAIAVLALPPLDILALTTALGIACFFASRNPDWEMFKIFWLQQLPLWVGLPFLALVASRAYHRVWSRARVSEYFLVGAGLGGGVLITAGLSMMFGRGHPAMTISVYNLGAPTETTVVMGHLAQHIVGAQTMLYLTLGIFFVLGLRLFPRAVRDAMVWTRRRTAAGDAQGTMEILIYGAGDGCALLMAHRDLLSVDDPRQTHVAGIIDEDLNLHGRYIHGYRVLGGHDALAAWLDQHRVDAIVIADPPTTEQFHGLQALAATHQVRLLRWQADLRPVRSTSQAVGAEP